MSYHSPGMSPATIVVMGVSGSGKTTVARLLSERLSCPMLEGDSLHSPENIRRMAQGIALSDDDRRDWLAAIAERIGASVRDGHGLVVSCSALKRRYRDVLRLGDPHLIFVHLAGDKQTIRHRMSLRGDHFMPPTLLDSQFDALEMPGRDEAVVSCDIAASAADIVASVLARLGQRVPGS
jgi:gluconokinase